MPDTGKPKVSSSEVQGAALWQYGSETDTDTKLNRVVPTIDKIKARDINELRDQIEKLYNHKHTYTDNVGGGTTTTTCG